MLFTLDEIMAITDSFIAYKKSDKIYNEKYAAINDIEYINDNAIFFPYSLVINHKSCNSFTDGTAYKAVKNAQVRGIFLDKESYLSEEGKTVLNRMIKEDYLDFVIITTTLSASGAFTALAEYTLQSRIDKDMQFIGVTGSVGKTTTTEMVYSIFSQSHAVYKSSVKNLRISINNAIVNIDNKYDFGIFELSGAVKGRLAEYSNFFVPKGIIITRVTSEGIGEFQSIDNIACEKSKLMKYMGKDDVAILDDSCYFRRYADLYEKPRKIFVKDGDYKLLESGKWGSRFVYKDKEYEIPIVGTHQIDNAIKAIELARALEIDEKDIYSGLKTFKQAEDRWVVDKYKNDATLITDIPNNPSYETLIANIKTFIKLYKDEPYKRLCISSIQGLGDFEIEYYLKIAKFLISLNVDEITVLDTEKDEKVKFIYEYVRKNSNIKTLFFKRPQSLDLSDPFVKYLSETLNFPQATLLKIQDDNNTLRTGRIKDILKEALKETFIGRE